ncbi:hypothetical protein, partial [Bradyrhizobium sp. Lot33]
DQIGILRGECSECCARSFRNPARHQLGTVRTIISESADFQKLRRYSQRNAALSVSVRGSGFAAK